MGKERISRLVICGTLVVAVGVALVLLLSGAAAAPTTQGLILQAAGQAGTAATGNRNEAYLIVAAYNEAGPIHGIAGGSFLASVVAAPTGADPIKKVVVTEPVSGVYKIALTPDLSSHRWSSGKYVVSVTFTSPNGSGVTVGELVID